MLDIARDMLFLCCIGSVAYSCTPPAPAPDRDLLTVALDSATIVYPCASSGFPILANANTWSRSHACAVAGRAADLLATSQSAEPHFAPSDVQRIRRVSVRRVQFCILATETVTSVHGRMGPRWYVVEIDVPERERFITVSIDAETLKGEIGVVHKNFDGSDTLMLPETELVFQEPGAACGD